MIAFLRRRRAEADITSIELRMLAHWRSQAELGRERALRNRRPNWRWLPSGRES